MNNLKKYDVAFVFNRNYIGQFKVTLCSLTRSNPNVCFKVHMLYDGLTDEDKQDICRFVKECGSEPYFYEADISLFAGLPKMPGDESYSTYKKLLIPELINVNSKVLYLDCDIIVRGDISELFEENNAEYISATKDERVNLKRKKHVEAITGDASSVYFNAGVLLFDLSKRDNRIPLETACSYMSENADMLLFHDQDMFNHFYAKNYTLLDGKYDYMTTFHSISDIFFPKGKKKAVILHYANWKPWNDNYIGRFYGLYKKFYKMCQGEKGVDFMKKRTLGAQLKLIFKYIFKR